MDGFVSIASPLTTSIQKNVKSEWFEDYERNFQELKDRLTSTPVLTSPKGTKDFVVYFDAS